MGSPHTLRGRSVGLNKAVAVVTILGTLAAFVSLSHAFGQDCALRLACIHNQRQMCDAVNAYQADHAGINPEKLISVWRYYADPPEHFAICPADQDQVYSYDRKTGVVTCPNPAHRSSE